MQIREGHSRQSVDQIWAFGHFGDESVLATGFQITYFELPGKWFVVGKMRNLHGKYTGYYYDTATPHRLSDDDGIEFTDLFLNPRFSPYIKYKVLDEEELEEAVHKCWITEQLHRKAKKETEQAC